MWDLIVSLIIAYLFTFYFKCSLRLDGTQNAVFLSKEEFILSVT